jgi:Domain of unknown function (DUF5671)
VVHNLYRLYLYIVSIALLIFAAFAVGRLLNMLLTFTPLHGTDGYHPPPSSEVVQSLVFAGVALVIAGALGGLHYWLIRRDMQNDPAAGNSAIRSFFLNMTEAIGIVLAVPVAGFLVFSMLASSQSADVVGAAAFALATLLVVVLLELERRRTQISQGAALAFQRLHFYGVQVLLLIFLTFAWLSESKTLLDTLFFAGRNALAVCSANGDITYCPRYSAHFLFITLLWFVAFWVGYGWIVRKDSAPLLRLLVHCLSFAYGIGFLLAGVYQVFRLIPQPIFSTAPALQYVLGPGATYDFFSPLTLGILVVGVYFVWLYMAARQNLIASSVLALTECTIGAILAAGVFWWGCGNALYNLFQLWVPVPQKPDVQDWIATLAFILAGVGYVPLDLYLRRRYALDAATAAGPRRGFVLALSGGGILALAIGGAVALYAWITSLFGSPVANWQQVAHGGLAAFIVGLILVVVYLGTAVRERLLRGLFKRSRSVAPALATTAPDIASVQPAGDATVATDSGVSHPAGEDMGVTGATAIQPARIEAILDELLAGKLTRDEAATRIRSLAGSSLP